MAARPVVLPEPFDGQSSWGDWKVHFEDVAEVNTWSVEQKLQWLRVRLTGHAQKASHRLPDESQASYDNKSPAGTVRTKERNDKVSSGVQIAVQEEDQRMGRFCGRPSLSG